MSKEFTGSPQEFAAQAREYAQRKYGYGELVDDNEERIAAALNADETPEYWVERLAEKYDLDPVTNGWI